MQNMSRATPLVISIALCAAVALPAGAITVKISVDESAESTRLVLSHSEKASYVVQSSRNKIKLLYARPIEVEPDEFRPDGRVLERWRQRDPRELVIETGPDYDRFESFELHNPFRLVLDLRARPKRSRRGRSRPRSQPKPPDTIIVIDPGHGGVEHGAVGPTGLLEKDITLILARRLRVALQQANPSVTVVLTRDEDRLVGLDERTSVANHNEAALFLSIHLNASPRTNANGAETYFLSTDATDDEARLLAAQENRSTERAKAAGDDDELDLVLWDLAQNQHLAASSALAESVQGHLNRLTGIRDRGVRQAPFRVLMGAMMPAVLVEVGFISNPDEEKEFRRSAYLNRVVDALVTALGEFLENLERFDRGTSMGRFDADSR